MNARVAKFHGVQQAEQLWRAELHTFYIFRKCFFLFYEFLKFYYFQYLGYMHIEHITVYFQV
jgi:hypothetical protein